MKIESSFMIKLVRAQRATTWQQCTFVVNHYKNNKPQTMSCKLDFAHTLYYRSKIKYCMFKNTNLE